MSTKNLNGLTKEYLEKEYIENKKSIPSIAEEFQTYPNSILRKMKKWGIERRERSESQKNALSTGRATHPTEGTTMSEESKIKISEGISEVWKNLSPEELEERKNKGKENWNKKTYQERKEFNAAGTKACRTAARHGTKLELYLQQRLIEDGFAVQLHKEQFLLNGRLQIDLFLPQLKTCVEIDGISHREAVWGQKSLTRTQRADREKSGLILNSGLVMIRVRAKPRVSDKYCRDLYAVIKEKLDQIKVKYPERDDRLIEIELKEEDSN
jgi:very-short-patch-repair endonuclease